MSAVDIDRLSAARSLLFVPGHRPELFAKAAASEADVVVLDLEDGVPPARRAFARQQVAAWLDAGHTAVVRINAIGTEDHRRDLDALAGRDVAVMPAKAEDPGALEHLGRHLSPGSAMVPLVETPVAVLRAAQIARVRMVVRLALGTVDLAADLGVAPSAVAAFTYARSKLVVASAAAGIAGPVDGVVTALDDDDELVRQTRHASEMGFTGKLCIHPRQVETVNRMLQPDERSVLWARRIVEASSGEGVSVVEGEMVDAPVLRRARSILRITTAND